jgi:hypothetical protein
MIARPLLWPSRKRRMQPRLYVRNKKQKKERLNGRD